MLSGLARRIASQPALLAAFRQQPGRFFATTESLNLNTLGINNPNAQVFHNLSYEEIFEHEVKNEEGEVASNGSFTVDTGIFTGRSPKDKWFVKKSPSEDNLWWGSINQPITQDVFDDLYSLGVDHFNNVDKMYVFDGYCGANPATRKKVRFVTEIAWQHHFVRNMFIRPETEEEIANFEPDFTIINASKVTDPKWQEHNLHSEVFVGFNIEDRVAVIGGTWYGGEMKKGIFSMMNYWLPLEGIMAMHCSANMGKDGDTALFFGLSGTGKTTLSADPNRYLIGDDEHGWDDEGIFNFEGGCYAKTINLTEENEPEIYRAIKRDALLENVFLDSKNNNEPDYTNVEKTQNGRVSYPLYHIPNYVPSAMGGHPSNIIFLTCDAFGVLPPVSVLTPEQAMYHFLSGYTAKVAGTERGIKEPQATFSACFGAAFLTLHPTKYADLLAKKIKDHGTNVYLVNTGWSGGAYGEGERMSIKTTRRCIDAILDGSIESAEMREDELFGFKVPTALHDIDSTVLDPRNTWSNKEAFDQQAMQLAQMFKENYQQYLGADVTDYSPHGPRV